MSGQQFQALDLGTCEVMFNGTKIGATLGSVIFRDEVVDADVKEDGYGETPVDSVLTGRTVTIEVPLTRTSLTNLVSVTPGSTGTTNMKVGANIVGTARLATAAELVLKPYKDGVPATDTSTWLHVFKCAPLPKYEISFDNSNQRIFKVTFKAYPTTISGTTGLIYRIGGV
jgi:hypothetical protein